MIKNIHMKLLIFSSLLCLISVFVLQQSKTALNVQAEKYNNTIVIAEEYTRLKNLWDESKDIHQKLTNISKRLNVKNITIKKTKKLLKITVQESSLVKMDSFINRVLNESFIIESLSITKNKVQLEIRYKQ